MAETFQDNKIASNWNNAGGLVNIETIVVSGIRFPAPDDLNDYSTGVPFVNGEGITFFNGYPSSTWIMGMITWDQYWYIYKIILSNKFSGKVTVRTRTVEVATYANYNAILTIDTPSELDRGVNELFDFVWRFSRLEAL